MHAGMAVIEVTLCWKSGQCRNCRCRCMVVTARYCLLVIAGSCRQLDYSLWIRQPARVAAVSGPDHAITGKLPSYGSTLPGRDTCHPCNRAECRKTGLRVWPGALQACGRFVIR